MAETLTLSQALLAARGDAPNAADVALAVRDVRRKMARHFLTAGLPDEALLARLSEVTLLAEWPLPWDPNPEDDELRQAIVAAWNATQPAPPSNVVIAAMALAPAYYFPDPPQLGLLPQWLRATYAGYLLALPAIFFHIGESEEYTSCCITAMDRIHTAIFQDRLPDSPALADVVRKMNCAMIYFNDLQLRQFFLQRARIVEEILVTNECHLSWALPQGTSDTPFRIGVLHYSMSPGTETFYLLAHLEGSGIPADNVTLYLITGSETQLSDVVRPWVRDIVYLPQVLGEAVSRIRKDCLDLLLVMNNITHGVTFEARMAAHRMARLQVAGGGSPVTTGFSSVDLFLSSEVNDPAPDAQADYVERLVRLPGTAGYFAFGHDQEPQTIFRSRADLGIPEGKALFFSGANYFKITPEVLTTWAEILRQTPNSRLLLMPFNPNWGERYPVGLFLARLAKIRTEFGLDADRVHVLSKVPSRADLHGIMSLADVYLDSFPFPGSCSLIDPLVVGMPVVAMSGRRFRTGLAAGMLQLEQLDSAVCSDAAAYVERAVRLGSDTSFRESEHRRVVAAATPSLACLRTEPFARKFAAFCEEAITRSRAYTSTLRAGSESALREAVSKARGLAFADPPPALARLSETDVVASLLVPYLQTLAAEERTSARVVDVNAGGGELSSLFLEAGIGVDMFEVDPACAAQLAALETSFPSAAYHDTRRLAWPVGLLDSQGGSQLPGLGSSLAQAGAAIVEGVSLRDFLAERPGSIDLIRIGGTAPLARVARGIEFASAAPRLIMAAFEPNALRPGMLADRAAIESMAALGYRSVTFSYMGELLTHVALDFEGAPRGASKGIAVLYRRGDTRLLSCLVQLLEAYGPAATRPGSGVLEDGRTPPEAALQ